MRKLQTKKLWNISENPVFFFKLNNLRIHFCVGENDNRDKPHLYKLFEKCVFFRNELLMVFEISRPTATM